MHDDTMVTPNERRGRNATAHAANTGSHRPILSHRPCIFFLRRLLCGRSQRCPRAPETELISAVKSDSCSRTLHPGITDSRRTTVIIRPVTTPPALDGAINPQLMFTTATIPAIVLTMAHPASMTLILNQRLRKTLASTMSVIAIITNHPTVLPPYLLRTANP